MKKVFLLIILLLLNDQIIGQKSNGLLLLEKFIRAENVDSLILANVEKSYNNILADVTSYVNEEEDIYDRHEILWDILHKKYLVKYVEPSYISATLTKSEYNCVTATTLYYALGKDLNLPTKIIETPHHVYLTFQDDTKEIVIELTSPKDGFDFDNEMDDYIEYLLEYELITQKELGEKGASSLYNELILESKPIESERLLSIYYGNLIIYKLQVDDSYSAAILGFNSIENSRDSSMIKEFPSIWNNYVSRIYNNGTQLNAFLIESLKYNSVSLEYEESLINACALNIEELLSKSEFTKADSLLRMLTNNVKYISENDEKIKNIENDLLARKIYSSMMLGSYKEGLNLAQHLYRDNPNNLKSKEIYISVARQFLQNQVTSLKFEEVREILDTLIYDLPGIRSVEDIYVGTILLHVFGSGLNSINPEKSEQILLEIYSKIPENPNLKKGIGHLYHSLAMSEIRVSNYKKAVKYLEQGLEYDPLNPELKSELKLTSDLVKTGAR